MEFSPISSLPDVLLVEILWPAICGESESDAPKVISAHPYDIYRKSIPPLLAPPASADAAWNLAIASVCRRWRRLAQRHVRSLFVREDVVVSRQDLANAIACFPRLTHLHLGDGSVETVDDSFLHHLATTCPMLRALHVGLNINLYHEGDNSDEDDDSYEHDDSYEDDDSYPVSEDMHPITEAGLDRFFSRCSRIEQLSLFCLHKDVELPASFFQLSHLHTLALTNASALESPGLTNLGALSTLYIASPHLNQQQFLRLSHLSSLTSLLISFKTRVFENDYSFSNSSASLQLPHLKSLEVNGRDHGFQEMFPSGLPSTSLQRLQVDSTDDDGIRGLTSCLRELNLFWCPNLSELPEEFTLLGRLEALRICGCDSFSRIPDNIGELTSLKLLELDALPLDYLPRSLCQLTRLETLDLVNCEELMIPYDIGALCHLQVLCLGEISRNQLLLPPSFVELSAITILQLKHSMLRELREGIGNLSSLQQLHISSSSYITQLPDSFSHLTGLEVLIINGCKRLSSAPRLDGLRKLIRCTLLTEPPASLPPYLEILVMPSYNQPAALFDVPVLPSLRKLELTNVGAGCSLAIGTSATQLRQLKLELAEEAEDLPSPFPALPHLHTIHISSCAALSKLPKRIGSCLLQLRSLRIDESSLRGLPSFVCELLHLTSLEIGESEHLVSLPGSIGALTRLRKLNVSGCGALKQLPAPLSQLTCLHVINASGCAIRSLPAGFARLTRLRRLPLNDCAMLRALPHDLTELRMLRYLGIRGCMRLRVNEDIRRMYGLHVDADDSRDDY